MPYDVFISYSSKDKKIADAVCSKLENSKVKCWIAPRDIIPGQTFAGSITKAIKNSTVFLLIFSPNANNSDNVLNEVELAKRNAKVIVPFKTDEFELNPDLEYYLASVHWMEAITGNIEKSIEKLVEHIKQIVPIFVEGTAETDEKLSAKKPAKQEEKPKEPSISPKQTEKETLKDPVVPPKGTEDAPRNAASQANVEFYKIKKGDIVKFGKYRQDYNPANIKGDIEWRVLALINGKALLLSEKILDCKKYNDEQKNVTWETCTLRMWLNDQFYNNAFSEGEKLRILTTDVFTANNMSSRTQGGKNTNDKVFLLSLSEANEKSYAFKANNSADIARAAQGTVYAKSNGLHVNLASGNSSWWLRTPGNAQHYACAVISDGYVNYYGYGVSYTYIGVRPAIWISI